MIGVLIPVHNEQALLPDCLDAALIAARHPGLQGEAVQILLVLDSCSDDSAAIVQSYPVQHFEVAGAQCWACARAGCAASAQSGRTLDLLHRRRQPRRA